MNLGFGKEESFVSDNLPLLKPWDIYEVEFDGVEQVVVDGKKDPTKKFNILKWTFKNENGQYVESLFIPSTEDDNKRTPKVNKNGHETENPSSVEVFMKEIGQLLTFIAPKALAAMKGKSFGVDALVKFLIDNLNKTPIKGTKVAIKLVGNKNNMARFPYFLNVFEKGGEAKITNNFISDSVVKLGFTAYELNQKEIAATAKPTNMNSVSSSNNLEDNLEDDLGDINVDLL